MAKFSLFFYSLSFLKIVQQLKDNNHVKFDFLSQYLALCLAQGGY